MDGVPDLRYQNNFKELHRFWGWVMMSGHTQPVIICSDQSETSSDRVDQSEPRAAWLVTNTKVNVAKQNWLWVRPGHGGGATGVRYSAGRVAARRDINARRPWEAVDQSGTELTESWPIGAEGWCWLTNGSSVFPSWTGTPGGSWRVSEQWPTRTKYFLGSSENEDGTRIRQKCSRIILQRLK